MTVQEVIEQLTKYPADMEVWGLVGSDEYGPGIVNRVYTEEGTVMVEGV